MSDERPPAHNGRVLMDRILERSAAAGWDEAQAEWSLGYAYRIPDDRPPGRCLCGHRPIREVCVLVNGYTGELAKVGSVCVRRFVGPAVPVEPFTVLARVRSNPRSSVRPAEADALLALGWLNEWEAGFCRSTGRRTYNRLSSKQQTVRLGINARLPARAEAATGHAGRDR